MKKKVFALLLIAVMVLSSFSAVFADEKGSITITNAANGEDYTIIKVFDARHNEDGTVNYYGTIPAGLTDYFEKQPGTVDGIQKKANVDDAALLAAVKDWGKANKASGTTQKADGGALVFDNLDFGYYVVLSSQGAEITINSANPDAVVIDKNTSEPTLSKTINDHNVSIGDTVTYEVEANAPNYLDGTKKVVSYQFEDTLPEFITDVNITSITVTDGDGPHTITDGLGAWNPNSRKAIAWVDGEGNHLYKNDAVIKIVYTAKITAAATEGGGAANAFGANINIVTMIPKVVGPEPGSEPEDYEKEWKDEDYTKTYAVALIKTNDANERLENAKFQVKGLVVTGDAGEYTVVSYDPEAADYTGATEMVTGADGTIIIHGLASDVTLTAQETEAPAGYNKLDGDFTLTPQIVSEEVTKTTTIQKFATTEKGTCKTEEDWAEYLESTTVSSETVKTTYNTNLVAASATTNTVVNKTGSVLPSTGGIGTTIIYILGAALVIGAGVMLVTRKKMNDR